MKFSAVLFALAALTATTQVAATNEAAESSVHVHIRYHKNSERDAGAICYKQCPAGQYCARGTSTCRPPKTGSTECFNPATSLWISKCDPGFHCSSGKCVAGGGDSNAICYKQCPAGQYCARGTMTCRPPKTGTTECFNPATSLWISKCDPGFKCVSGKCAYAHQKAVAEEDDESEETENEEDSNSIEVRAGADGGAICYKQCPAGQHCARGTTTCRPPKAGTTECFNPATSLWISKCDPGFKCAAGKCVYAHHKSHKEVEVRDAGAICYKQCPAGQHCARGTTTCRPPKAGTTECFNPATALWISKCDPGFKCASGKCVYAH